MKNKTDKKIEIKEFEEKFAILLEKWKLSPDFSYEYLIKETSNMVTNLLNTEVQKAREEALGEFMKMVKIDPDSCFYRFNVPEQMAISTYINEIFEKVGNYLQTLKDKDDR